MKACHNLEFFLLLVMHSDILIRLLVSTDVMNKPQLRFTQNDQRCDLKDPDSSEGRESKIR